ncbi:MAG: PKD domain-containing protein [Dysgonamonadaceae bacterium]|nr:PKD domain-containing protein [Dysgonamonadaceae bacterium]
MSLILFICIHSSCFRERVVEVIPDFSYESGNDDYEVPVTLTINNMTTGATTYSWTFEGGIPQTSDKKNPGEIRYLQAGKYTIRLEAANDFHRSVRETEVVIDSSASVRFVPEVLINPFVPADVKIHNLSTGGDSYEWMFEGGTPASGNGKEPPLIRYEQPGEYEIRLEVKAGRKTHSVSEKIQLLPALQTDFKLVPSVESVEMEAPWRGYLQNETTNGMDYLWSSTGGKIGNDTARHTGITIDSPGTYTVTLEAGNRKQKKQKSQTVEIKPNSNLYRFENVRLGINTASSGYFFSSVLRKAFTQGNLEKGNGKAIDFVFFGLNSGFAYCTFLSPDKAQNTVFEPIPEAVHTKFVLFPEKTGIPFSATDFDEATDDGRIRNLPVSQNAVEETYFTSAVLLPKLVLFETDDGRKGAIKIKEFIDAGLDSYITVDIKVQKKKP